MNIKNQQQQQYQDQNSQSSVDDSLTCSSDKIDINQQQTYKLYRRRFLILFAYQLTMISTNLIYGAITPIGIELQQIYNKDNNEIVLGPQLFLLAYPIFVIPAGKLIENYGFTKSIYLAIILNLIAIWLRCFINTSFVFIIISYTLLGISKPFFSTAQGKVTMNWLPVMERPIATAVLQFLNTYSIASGFFWPGTVFNDYDINIDQQFNYEKGKNLSYNLMLNQAITGTILFIPAILFLREKPPQPPSFGATVPKIPATIQTIIKNKNYLYLLFSYGPLMGIFNSFPVIVSFFIKPYGFDSIDASLISSVPLFMGPIGIITIGYLMRKYRCYIRLYQMCIIVCLICVILFPILLQTRQIGYVLISSMLNGIFLSPIVPLIIELSIELTFPLGESLIIGLIFSSSLLSGFLLSFAITAICKGQSIEQTVWTCILMAIICVICLIITFFIKEDLRRWKAENSQSINHIQNDNSDQQIQQSLLQNNLDQADNLQQEELQNKNKQQFSQQQQYLLINEKIENKDL